jgi:Domain of unknown function (DUF3806)
VSWFRRKPAAAEQKIDPPTDAEREWVRANVELARELTGGELTPEALDAAYARWLEQWLIAPEDERDDPNLYVNAFGLGFAQLLVDTLGLEWAVVSDELGTEIAVHGQPGDVLVFPPNLVAKRLEAGETGFFVQLYEALASRVRELRA